MNKQYFQEIKLASYDVDTRGAGRAGAYLRYLQEVGGRQMELDRPGEEELRKLGQAYMITRLDMRVNEPVFQKDVVVASSWACESKRATFLRCYEIRKEGRIAIEAATQWALVQLESRKILSSRDVDMSRYFIGEYRQIFKDKLKFTDDVVSKMKEVDKRRIFLRDTDRNGHMNNTYYIDMFCDYIDGLVQRTHGVKTLRIHFVNEAQIGEILSIYMAREGNVYKFRSFKSDGMINVNGEITVEEME